MDGEAKQRAELQNLATVLMYFGSTGFFLTFLYVALYLKQSFDLDAPVIGAIIGIVTLTSASLSWLGGGLADRFGTMKVMIACLLAYFVVTVLMALTHSLWAFVICIFGLGLVRSVLTPTHKGLFALADDGKGGAFRMRFIALTSGFLSAGVIGRIFSEVDVQIYFWMSCGFYLLCALIVWMRRGVVGNAPVAENSNPQTSDEPISKVGAMALIVLFGFLLLLIISQFESNLPLYLLEVFGENGGLVYRNEVIIGGAGSIVFGIGVHLFRNRYPEFNERVLIGISTALAALSIGLFFSSKTEWVFYFACFVFVLAEVVMLPVMDALAMPLMHAGNRGRVMGLLEIRQLAFFIGPVMGGWLLDYHLNWLPWVLASVAAMMFPVYLGARRAVDSGVQSENFTRHP